MWLAIEGVVGAGKTTTSSLVSQLTGAESALERLEEHPFLDDYYRDPARYAVETELAFMLLQLHQLRRLAGSSLLISDFAPPKNLIFARLETTGEDLRFLEAVDAYLWKEMPQPDLAVFLDVPPQICLERVRARARPYEMSLRVDDLKRIRDAYVGSLDSLAGTTLRLELEGGETREEVAGRVIQLANLS